MTPAREKQLLEEIARQRADIERLTLENQLLRDKVNLMLARLFDKSSESIDPENRSWIRHRLATGHVV